MIEVLVDGLDHPESVCWDPHAGVVWAGGEAGQLYRVELEERRFAEVARAPNFVLGGTVPDGVAFTADGDVLVSCYRPDRIVHLGRDGVPEIVAEDPQGTLLSAPTNIAFAGPGLDRLVCANLGRWHLALVDSGLRGAPLHCPTRWAADA